MAVELICELATAHGGDVALAEDMVAAAADAGAHTVKIQCYIPEHVNPSDPQAEWLRKSWLCEPEVECVIKACQKHRVGFLATAFDRDSLLMLLRLRQHRIKVASSQPIWNVSDAVFVKSWPWGQKPGSWLGPVDKHLTAIPLYPTPLEAVAGAPLLDGWSDHTVGIEVCQHMLSRGASVIEAHFCLPGRSRQMPWDKTPEQFRAIRDWADRVETMRTGVATHFRDRWQAA